MLWKIILAQFAGAFIGAVFAMDNLEARSDEWRRAHPVAKVPIDWMPTVCPVDPITELCQSNDRGLQVFFTTIIATFLFVSVALLVKSP